MITRNPDDLDLINKKRILVTGGTGSIGSAVVKYALSGKPDYVRVLTNDENALFLMEREIGKDTRARFMLGDVRDKDRMLWAAQDVDIIFHCAALKHVLTSEYNPFEVIRTNVLGTQNVIESALTQGVETFALISTDKAVNPISTMGASKLLCERLVTDASFFRGAGATTFFSVRFGNVLNTRGSVFQIFREQISRGDAVTITDSSMTRFVCTIDQAVSLIFKAARYAWGGEVFVLKMPAMTMGDFADAMIETLAPRHGYEPTQIKKVCVGPRRGEKQHEELMTSDEASRSIELDGLIAILTAAKERVHYPEYSETQTPPLSSKDAHQLGQNELRELILLHL